MSEERRLKTEKNVAYRESSLHMNYLYQLAMCTLAQSPTNLQLVKFYTQTMQSIAKKLVLRIDPSIKRTLCKKCFMLLVPGITATVRMRSRKCKRKHTVVQCLECKRFKRFNSNADYKLWTEQTDAWIEKNKQKIDEKKPPPAAKKKLPEAAVGKNEACAALTSTTCTLEEHKNDDTSTSLDTDTRNSICTTKQPEETKFSTENGCENSEYINENRTSSTELVPTKMEVELTLKDHVSHCEKSSQVLNSIVVKPDEKVMTAKAETPCSNVMMDLR